MEIEQMKEKLENHEGRLVKVEVTQEVHGEKITNNEGSLKELLIENTRQNNRQHRLFIIVALLTGAYLGSDKVFALVGKLIGG